MFANIHRSPTEGAGSQENLEPSMPREICTELSRSDGLVVAQVRSDEFGVISDAAQKLFVTSGTSIAAIQWSAAGRNKETLVARRVHAELLKGFLVNARVGVLGVDLKVEGGEVLAGAHLTFDGRITEIGYAQLRRLAKQALSAANGAGPA